MILPTVAALFSRLPRFFRRHRLMKLWMGLTGEDPVQFVCVNREVEALADLSDGFLRLIVIEGDYDEEFFRVAEVLLGNTDVFLDVGANFGLLSFGLAGRPDTAGVDFHLFEPNPSLVGVIERTKQRFPKTKITLNTVAVSDRAGELPMRFLDHQTGASHYDPESEERCRAIALDDYLEEKGIGSVALLKIDVEGHELAALRGAERSIDRSVIGTIYFEYFEKNLVKHHDPKALLSWLENRGFVICLCRRFDLDHGGGPTHEIFGFGGRSILVRRIRPQEAPVQTDLLAVRPELLHSFFEK